MTERPRRRANDLERACRRAIAASAWLALACGSGSNDYARAAVALGTTVLATGTYRAITGECWAQCRPGYVCDRERGLCIRAECAPGCPVGTHCVREVDGRFACVDDVGSFQLGPRADPPPPAVDAGAPVTPDAGALLAPEAGAAGNADPRL